MGTSRYSFLAEWSSMWFVIAGACVTAGLQSGGQEARG